MKQKKWPEAIPVLRQGLTRQPVPILVVQSYVALQETGRQADATALVARWNTEHPEDVSVRTLIGERSLQTKDYPMAIRQFKALLALQPDSSRVLNQLAWALVQSGDVAAARGYAEKAYNLEPYNADVMDTYALTLLKSGDVPKALELLRSASTLAPANDEIRLHLATALIKSGDKAGGKRELDVLGKLDTNSPLRAEVDKLRQSL